MFTHLLGKYSHKYGFLLLAIMAPLEALVVLLTASCLTNSLPSSQATIKEDQQHNRHEDNSFLPFPVSCKLASYELLIERLRDEEAKQQCACSSSAKYIPIESLADRTVEML